MKLSSILCASFVALAALALTADGASAASSIKSSKSNTSDRTAGSQGCPMDQGSATGGAGAGKVAPTKGQSSENGSLSTYKTQGSATGGAGAGKSRIPQQGLYSTSPVSAVGQQEKTASNTHPCGNGNAGPADMKYEGTTNVENLKSSEKAKQPQQSSTPAPK